MKQIDQIMRLLQSWKLYIESYYYYLDFIEFYYLESYKIACNLEFEISNFSFFF